MGILDMEISEKGQMSHDPWTMISTKNYAERMNNFDFDRIQWQPETYICIGKYYCFCIIMYNHLCNVNWRKLESKITLSEVTLVTCNRIFFYTKEFCLF